MKKFLIAFLVFFPAKLHASIIDEGVTREKTFVVHFTTTVPANAVSVFNLVSLSTTASLFPHTANNPSDIGEIDVSHINILMDKVATATTTIKVGVCTFVNSSTGSATYFFSRSSQKNVSNTDVVVTANFTPAFYRCKVRSGATATNSLVDGKTPFLLSNDTDSGSSALNSTTLFASPNGPMFLRPGDIVLKVGTDATNTVNVIIDVWYHAEP